jgi:nitrogen fixation-related uncharacterized protein
LSKGFQLCQYDDDDDDDDDVYLDKLQTRGVKKSILYM